MKLSYQEGTWFAVPLTPSGFAIGLVAKATAEGKVVLCYFFGPRRGSIPRLIEVENLSPKDSIRAHRISDLALIRGEWPIIGRSKPWRRSKWPVPVFIRRDPLRSKAWRVYRSNEDPNVVVREEPEPYESTSYERDSVLGAGAAEIVLSKQLA